MSPALLIVGRIALSAGASTLQKRLVLRGVGSVPLWAITYLAMTPLALATVAWDLRQMPGDTSFWRDACLAGVLDAFGNLAMINALRTTDLSVYGSLNGLRPALALVFGWLCLGERVSPRGGLGVGLTVVGAALLLRNDRTSSTTHSAWTVLAWRTLGLGLSAFAAVFLKRAVLAGPVGLTLSLWTLCGLLVFWPPLLRARADLRQLLAGASERRLLLANAGAFFAMQWLTLGIFQTTLLAYSFAFFQLGILLQVLFGHLFLDEQIFNRRLVFCAVIMLGALLITTGGH